MIKKFLVTISAILTLCFMLTNISYAQEKQSMGEKVKRFWRKLFEYPANVTNETAGVVTEAITGATNVVTNEVKTVGQVTSGNLEKAKDLVTEPLVGTTETTTKAIEGAVAVPIKSDKEESK